MWFDAHHVQWTRVTSREFTIPRSPFVCLLSAGALSQFQQQNERMSRTKSLSTLNKHIEGAMIRISMTTTVCFVRQHLQIIDAVS